MPAAIYGIGKFPNNAPVFGVSLSLLRQLFYEQGKSVSAIAAETGHDRKTISQYLDMTDFNTPEPNEYHGAAGPGIIRNDAYHFVTPAENPGRRGVDHTERIY